MEIRLYCGMILDTLLAALLKSLNIEQSIMQGIMLVLISCLLSSRMANSIGRDVVQINWWKFIVDCQCNDPPPMTQYCLLLAP
jgi:hypothetical protein